jgi:hypothetical protein
MSKLQVAAGILPAVEGGIPAARIGARMAQDGHSAGQDARLYGRQDARRYLVEVPGRAGSGSPIGEWRAVG